jgi:dTDP-4-dehydrorhamnose reductase
VSSNIAPRILITGKNGQVGRELTERAAELGINFVAFDSKELDIRDRAAVLAAVVKFQPTAVINAAAYTAVDKAEEEEEELAYAVNNDGVRFLAEAAQLIGAKLIHISTDYVFDGDKQAPYTVDDAPNPTSVYGASKLAGEKAMQDVLGEGGNYLVLRVSWVFGQYGNDFVKTMLKLAETRNELSVVNDQYSAPTPASEIAKCLLSELALNNLTGIQHLESNPGVTWCEFAQAIFEAANRTIKINGIPSEQYPSPVDRPKNSKLSSDNITLKVQWGMSLRDLVGVNQNV